MADYETLREALMMNAPGVTRDLRDIVDEAARWRHVRDHLTLGGSPHMDNTWTFRFASPSGRGRTVDEVVDRLIEKSKGIAT